MTDAILEPISGLNPREVFFELPLYEVVAIEKLISELGGGTVDAYSVQNSIDTTYEVTRKNLNSGWPYLNGHTCYELRCVRRGEVLTFFFIENDKYLVKIGQFPSLADMQYAELGTKYDKLVDKFEIVLLKKAIGLAAHGAGAGAFVYLRRVFEKLILETYEKHASELKITRKEFLAKRMTEKVDVLKKYLPSQLVKMKAVYNILSKGVHELTEKECLTYFPAIKLSIQLILDQRLEEAVVERRERAVVDQIRRIEKELKNDQKD